MPHNLKKTPENIKNFVKDSFNYSLDDFELINNIKVGDFQPGEMGIFHYTSNGPWSKVDKSFFVLCVSNKRSGAQAVFSSSAKNRLLSAFKTDSISKETLSVLIHIIYNAKAALYKEANYRNLNKRLGLFLGNSNYRTFDLTKMSNVSVVEVNFLEDRKI